MSLLLDTHLLPWAAGAPERLSAEARAWLPDGENVLAFSAASIWEVTLERGLGRQDFRVDPRLLRKGLLANGYGEIPVTGEHAVEGCVLLTSDAALEPYGGRVRVV